jgi:hypothetical protein
VEPFDKKSLYFEKQTMSSTNVAALASIGAVGGVGLVLGIAALSVSLVDQNNINTLQTNVTTLQNTSPVLVNDGSNVSNSVSLLGVPPITGATTMQPQYHFKSLAPGNGIAVTDAVTSIVISNTLNVTLTSNTSTNVDAVSIVSPDSQPNLPIVRQLIAGTGIHFTLDGEGNLVIST